MHWELGQGFSACDGFNVNGKRRWAGDSVPAHHASVMSHAAGRGMVLAARVREQAALLGCRSGARAPKAPVVATGR